VVQLPSMSGDADLMEDLFGSDSDDEAEQEQPRPGPADEEAPPHSQAGASELPAGPPGAVPGAVEPEPEPEHEPESEPSLPLPQPLPLPPPLDDESIAAAAFRRCPLVRLVQQASVGGGRGVVAARDLPAGTILMREQPFLPQPASGWPNDAEGALQQLGEGGSLPLHTAVCLELLSCGMARAPELAELHPQTLAPPHLSAEQLDAAWVAHGATVDALLQGRQGGYSREELLRCGSTASFPPAFSASHPLADTMRH